MFRRFRSVLAGLALLVAAGGSAQAQYYYPYGYGYEGYGFGGWGGTPQGNILQGMGAFAEGAGVYNYKTAVADSINTDTAIKLNQYIWNSELESRQRYAAHQARRLSMTKDQYKARQMRIRNSPMPEDIESGEALNVLLQQITDPKIMTGSSSTLRLANGTIPSSSIREIPFRDETDAITISLDELTEPKSWPAPLQSDDFKAEREAYQKAVDDALAEDKEGGSLKPETVTRVRNSVSQFYKKVEATIPKTQQPGHNQAMNYLKGLAGLSRMLERPNVDKILGELEKFENTTIGHLVGFMHSYNLRFAPATTVKQRAVYRELYPLMLASRDKVVGKPDQNANANANTEETPARPQPVEDPTSIFYGLDSNHLHPKAPTPATPPVETPKP